MNVLFLICLLALLLLYIKEIDLFVLINTINFRLCKYIYIITQNKLSFKIKLQNKFFLIQIYLISENIQTALHINNLCYIFKTAICIGFIFQIETFQYYFI